MPMRLLGQALHDHPDLLLAQPVEQSVEHAALPAFARQPLLQLKLQLLRRELPQQIAFMSFGQLGHDFFRWVDQARSRESASIAQFRYVGLFL
jgi:hypothetical protein